MQTTHQHASDLPSRNKQEQKHPIEKSIEKSNSLAEQIEPEEIRPEKAVVDARLGTENADLAAHLSLLETSLRFAQELAMKQQEQITNLIALLPQVSPSPFQSSSSLQSSVPRKK